MDTRMFYNHIRNSIYRGRISQDAVNGFETLIFEWSNKWQDKISMKEFAYVLATTYHETAHTMQPIREYGKGKGRKYGTPHPETGHVYYGRGYVQLTWDDNYKKASQKIGVDFYNNPDLVMKPDHAATILFQGMYEGWFTGKALSDYNTYKSMRRIINGTDEASLIAGYAEAFYTALEAANGVGDPVVQEKVPHIAREEHTEKEVKDSRIMSGSKLLKWFSSIFGGGVTMNELVSAKQVTEISKGVFGNIFEGVELSTFVFPSLLAFAVVMWFISHRIGKARLEDHQTGKTL